MRKYIAEMTGTMVAFRPACIHHTGTSVGPTRSTCPTLFQESKALSRLRSFIVGPFIGATPGAFV